MRQIDRANDRSGGPGWPGREGVVFSVVDAEGRAFEREICTDDPEQVMRYYQQAQAQAQGHAHASGAGRVAGVAWRFGPLQSWRWQGGPRVPAPLREPEFRRVQSCAYRCLAGYLARCELPQLAIAASMSRYGGYYPDLYSGMRSIVEHEIASSLSYLLESIDVHVLAESLVAARGLETFTVPRYPGDEADALPPGIFLLRTT